MHTHGTVGRAPARAARWRSFSHRALIALACVVAVLLTGQTPARAQDDAMAMIFLNPVGRESIQRAKKILGLDAEQLAAANDLHAGYRAGIKHTMASSQEAQQEAMQRASEKDDYAAMRKVQQESMKKVIAEVDALTRTFNEDFKAVLTPAQLEKFASFERSRRRESGRYVQLLAGEGLDLVALLDGMDIAWREKADIAGAIGQYELDLDRSLVEREKLFREAMEKIFGGVEAEESAVRGLLPKLMQQAKVSRDINRNAARTIGTLLAPEDRARLETEVRERSFPAIYRDRSVRKTAEGAKKIAGVSEAQLKELDEVVKNYERDAAAINQKWASAIDAAQEKSLGNADKIMGGDEEDDRPAEEAMAQRDALDKACRARLESVLSEEQRKALPVIRPTRRPSRAGVEPDPDRAALKEWGDGDEADDEE